MKFVLIIAAVNLSILQFKGQLSPNHVAIISPDLSSKQTFIMSKKNMSPIAYELLFKERIFCLERICSLEEHFFPYKSSSHFKSHLLSSEANKKEFVSHHKTC